MDVSGKFSWFKRTFWLWLAAFAGFLAIALSQKPPLSDLHSIANYMFWGSCLVLVVHLYLLGALASYVGKSPALWVIGAVVFATLGIFVAFVRMCDFVEARVMTQPGAQSPIQDPLFKKPDRPGSVWELLAWLFFEYRLLKRYGRRLSPWQRVPLVCRAYLVFALFVSVLYFVGIGLTVGFELPARIPWAYEPLISEGFVSQSDGIKQASLLIEKSAVPFALSLAMGLVVGLVVGLGGGLGGGLAWGLAVAVLGLTVDFVGGLLAVGLAYGLARGVAGGLLVGYFVGDFAWRLAGGFEAGFAAGLVAGLALIAGYAFGFLSIPFTLWHVLRSAFRVDFYRNPYLGDGGIRLPLPGIRRRLTALAEEDPETARRFIAFLLEYRPLQRGLAMHLTHAASAGEWRQHVLDPDYLRPPEVVAEEPRLRPSEAWIAAQGARLLAAMRSFSQRQNQVVFMFVGTELFSELHDPDWANYFVQAVRFPVDYLSREEAGRLITGPVRLRYAPEVIDRLFDLTQGHPALLQLLCRKLVDIANREGRGDLSLPDLDRALAEAIERETSVFAVFWNQFCRQRNCRETVERILSGEPPADTRALLQLQEHGYVVDQSGKWRMRVPLFESWLRRYKDAFI